MPQQKIRHKIRQQKTRLVNIFNGRDPDLMHDLLHRLNRYLPLRHRYVLTRNNTVRLRYVAMPVCAAVAVVTLGVAIISGPSSAALHTGSSAVAYASISPAAGGDGVDGEMGDDQTLVARLSATQKRMQRSYGADANGAAVADLGAGGMARDDASAVEPARVLAARDKVVKIAPGDTLTGALLQAGLSEQNAYGVVQAMKEHVNPRSIRPGQVIKVRFDPNAPVQDDKQSLAQVSMALDALKTVTVARQDGADAGFKSDISEKPVVKKLYTQSADISVSVVGSAAKAGIPPAVVNEAIRIYSWDVDFQRDIRQGDKIEITYEAYETEDGQRVKTGDVLYTQLSVSGIDIPLYRYKTSEGRVDYFQPNGRSIRKTLMKTPIDGARISSGFGVRKHPVLGYTKVHKGMDFAAPTGTPIYAAGDGVIERAGRFSSFGNYVRIRHNAQLKTAYAHLSRFGKGISPGTRVRQGQVIGYVGTTGRSTGPHLHYEVLVNGVQKNPRSLDLPTGESLNAEELRLFKAHVKDMDRDISDGRALRYARNNASSAQ